MTHKNWILQSINLLHVMILHPVFSYWKKKLHFFVSTRNKSIKYRVCLSSYPAGRCLWFRIFKENQTVPNQNYPGRAPILPGNNKHMYTGQMTPSSAFWNTIHTKQMQSNWPVLSLMGLVMPHLSFLPPSAIFVLFRRPAFSNSWEHINKGLKLCDIQALILILSH